MQLISGLCALALIVVVTAIPVSRVRRQEQPENEPDAVRIPEALANYPDFPKQYLPLEIAKNAEHLNAAMMLAHYQQMGQGMAHREAHGDMGTKGRQEATMGHPHMSGKAEMDHFGYTWASNVNHLAAQHPHYPVQPHHAAWTVPDPWASHWSQPIHFAPQPQTQFLPHNQQQPAVSHYYWPMQGGFHYVVSHYPVPSPAGHHPTPGTVPEKDDNLTTTTPKPDDKDVPSERPDESEGGSEDKEQVEPEKLTDAKTNERVEKVENSSELVEDESVPEPVMAEPEASALGDVSANSMEAVDEGDNGYGPSTEEDERK